MLCSYSACMAWACSLALRASAITASAAAWRSARIFCTGLNRNFFTSSVRISRLHSCEIISQGAMLISS